MNTLSRFRFRTIKPHWPHAWVSIGLIAGIACFVAMADGIRNWSVLVVYGIAAVSLFLSVQPWRSFIELDQQGIRVVWGAYSTVMQWRDITSLRPVLQHGGRYGGVTFSATAEKQSLLGVTYTRRAAITGRIDGRLYGISDGQLYQLMTHLRGRGTYDARIHETDAELHAMKVSGG